MLFQITQKSRLHFKPPEFKCDKCISPQIEYPLPSKPHFMVICGSAGSGKTSFMINMLTSRSAYKKVYENVHVVMPRHSVSSLKQNVFKSHDKMHDELDIGTLACIYDKVKEAAEEGDNSLIIMDDVTVHLKDLEVQKMLRDLILNRRHYRLSIWILSQTYNSLPLAIRKTISHLVMFKPRNKKEYQNIFEELLFIDRDIGDKLQGFIYDKPYSFMFSDIDTGEIFKNFDLVKINYGS